MTTIQTQLSSSVLEQSVQGQNLAGPTLGENLQARPTLLVFLRHFG